MNKYAKLALALVAILIAYGLLMYWFQYPRKAKTGFMSDLYHERYEEAARMLRAPSAIEVAPDGALTLVDHSGATTVVPVEQLPFKVGGGSQDIGDTNMTALGPSPAVVLYLSYDGGMTRFGGKIRIESVGDR